MAIRKHVHKLKRKTYRNKEQVYFCILDCDYKINTGLAVGKVVLCNRCGKQFAMTEYSSRLSRPHCPNCVEREMISKETKRITVFDEMVPVTEDQLDYLSERLTKQVTDDSIVTMQTKPHDTETENLKDRLTKAIQSSLDPNSDDVL